MADPLALLAILFAGSGIVFLLAGIVALRKGRLLRVTARLAFALLLLALAGLFGMVTVATQGYRALTREEVAAVVRTEPAGPKRFRAHFRFSDGRTTSFTLAGDELYVDAHILKWKPIANFLGLHTAYELDRVAGRYTALAEERERERTLYSLARDKPLDLFALRRRYALLAPLLDADYGSASFILADEAAEFELRVSTTGLLIRRMQGAEGGRGRN